MSRIIGIDLGTTNTLASCWQDGKSVLIPNRFGDFITPSVVSIDENGTVYTGKVAKERLITHPDSTVSSFKRFMGTDKVWYINEKEYHAEDLSALLLRAIKVDAEAFLGEEIEEAVVSVPAYFTDTARKATRNAGLLAGLRVDRIVNEPSAAALACRKGSSEFSDGRFIVYDFGGGTLDVSLVDCFENIVEINAVCGDNRLGGDDFNDAIAKYFAEKVGTDYALMSPAVKHILLKEAERCKKVLSGNDSVEMILDQAELSGRVVITKKDLVRLSKSVFERMTKPVNTVLKELKSGLNEVQAVILVGGSCKMPVVQQYLKFVFKNVPLVQLNPDYMVALGAGAYAGIKEKGNEARDIILTDICPFSLGTAVFNENSHYNPLMSVIIPRNSSLPCSKSETYTPVSHITTEMVVEVYQGEDLYAKNNKLIGKVEIGDLPVGPMANRSASVRYTYDINGLLMVKVTLLGTGKTEEAIFGADQTDEQIKERIAELTKLQNESSEAEYIAFAKARTESIFIQLSRSQDRSELISRFEMYLGVINGKSIVESRLATVDYNRYLDHIERDVLNHAEVDDHALDDFLKWMDNGGETQKHGTLHVLPPVDDTQE